MPSYGTSQTTDFPPPGLVTRRGAPHVPPKRGAGGHAVPLSKPRPMTKPKGK